MTWKIGTRLHEKMGAAPDHDFDVNDERSTRAYQIVEEVELAIDGYFDFCDEEERPPTVTGLAVFMGFSSRSALDMYQTYGDGYAYALARAKSIIEDVTIVGMLTTGVSPNGVSIILRNHHGFKDTKEHTVGFTPDALKRLSNARSRVKKAKEDAG